MNRSYLTGRSSVPCPRCNKLISRNSDRCIHCGLHRPGVYLSIPIIGSLLAGDLSFVDGILLANFVLFALALALDLPHSTLLGGIFNTLSPSGESLYNLGMGGTIPLAQGRWWSLLTANYLHGGILHIAFNMMWLRQLGFVMEELYGASRFWIIYTLAGVAGSVTSTLAGTEFFVGASGAVFGLFGALILYGWRRGGTFGSNLFRQMILWALFGLAFGFLMPNVDNWGHIGGLVSGAVLGVALGYQERQRQQLWHHLLAVIVLAGAAVCFGMMVAAFFMRG